MSTYGNWVIIIQYSSHYIKLPSTRMPHTNLNELSNFKQPDNANKFWCISKSRRTNPQYFFLNKYNERLKGLLVKEMEDMEEWWRRWSWWYWISYLINHAQKILIDRRIMQDFRDFHNKTLDKISFLSLYVFFMFKMIILKKLMEPLDLLILRSNQLILWSKIGLYFLI